jgi:hypothetical protein
MSGVMMALMGSNGAPSLQASFTAGLRNTSSTPGSYSVSISLLSDGTATSSGIGSASPTWVTPTSAGVGSHVWVAASAPSGGGNTNYTAGAWNSLASGVNFSVGNTSSTSQQSGGITLTFSGDAGGASVIGTGTFTYTVGATP